MANGIGKTARDEALMAAVGRVDQYLDATHDARVRSERARDYKDGYQWTKEEKQILRDRKQPCITNNRIKPKVQFLIGMEQQTRTRPKAFPRTPDAEDPAQASTDALRFIEDNNKSQQEFSRGFEYMLVEGTECHEVIVQPKGEEFEIIHNVIPWDRLWWDPHSRRADFSDAMYFGTKQWMDLNQAKTEFPDAPNEAWTLENSSSSVYGTDNTHEDRPNFFIDKKRKRVAIFFGYFIKGGVWHYEIFTQSGFIKKPAPSPYLDDNGVPEPQFTFQSAFVDIDGNRIGEVDSYLDLQDEINKRRSKLLHLMSVRQTWGNKGAIKDVSGFKKEAAKPDGHMEFENHAKLNQDFGFVPTNDMAAGQASLLSEAKQEIDAVGANAALAGTEDRLLSGKALRSLQQGGSVELGPLFEGHRSCKNRVHRMMWNRVKQFKTEEWWVRVTDDGGKLKFTRINGQIRRGDDIRIRFEEGGIEALTNEELLMVETGDPRLNDIVGVENPIEDMDVDIVMDEMEDFVTIQQEQFDVLARLYEANPTAIPFQLVVRASQLRNKDELMELLEGGTPEQRQALQAAQQKAQEEERQLLIADKMADIEVKQTKAAQQAADAEKKGAETTQTVVETAIDIEESVTDLEGVA